MFEQFPYTDMHQLNLDWIIKIAKDFLDQYTHIQELISTGEESISNLTQEELEQIQQTANNIESLLNQWYATHSEDIANQLAEAITSFTVQANDRAQEAIESIPSDYTELYDLVNHIRGTLNNIFNPENIKVTKAYNLSTANQRYGSGITYTINQSTGAVTAAGTANYDAWIHLYPGGTIQVPENGMYMLYGCPAGGSSSKYYLLVDDTTNTRHMVDYGQGAVGYLTNDKTYRVVFIVAQNQTVNFSFVPTLVKLTPELMKQLNAGSMVNNDANNIQYWNNETYIADTYYLKSGNAITLNSAGGYRTNKMFVPKGHIRYRNISGAFTFIYDLTTNQFKNLQNDYGKTQYLHNSDITLDHDSIIFATSNDEYQAQIVNGNGFPKEYKYGPFDESYIIISASGNFDFTKLNKGLTYVYQYPVDNVLVTDGVFNLITEYGDSYFANLSSSDNQSGIRIGNGTKIIFYPKTKVICNYTGNNEWVCKLFSPFNFVGGNEGYYISGLDLECSRVRYAIHDEGNNTAIPYINKLINCVLSLDNSNNSYWQNPLTIGGGLGQAGEINIKNCYIKTAQLTGYSNLKCVNYHNAAAAGSKSTIHVSNCYIENPATIGVSYYGSSTEKSTMYISGCSLPFMPYINREGAATIENVQIIQYANDIRN